MADQPIYTPFFGAMGATAAMAFSGKLEKTGYFRVNMTDRSSIRLIYSVCSVSFDLFSRKPL